MAYRDERVALRARITELEDRVAESAGRLEALTRAVARLEALPRTTTPVDISELESRVSSLERERQRYDQTASHDDVGALVDLEAALTSAPKPARRPRRRP